MSGASTLTDGRAPTLITADSNNVRAAFARKYALVAHSLTRAGACGQDIAPVQQDVNGQEIT